MHGDCTVAGGGTDGPVAVGGDILGAQALDDAVAGDEVGGLAGGGGDPPLLDLAAPLQGAAGDGHQPQQGRGSEKDRQAQRPGDDQEDHPGGEDGGDLADGVDEQLHRGGETEDITGGHGQQCPAEAAVGHPGGVQQPVGDLHPQPVLDLLHAVEAHP